MTDVSIKLLYTSRAKLITIKMFPTSVALSIYTKDNLYYSYIHNMLNFSIYACPYIYMSYKDECI